MRWFFLDKAAEAKLGCLFTQTGVDSGRRPQRDAEFTSYLGAIETSEEFCLELYAEAGRHCLAQATEMIVLGDGTPWVWNLAEEHFTTTFQIVGLDHVGQHLANAANLSTRTEASIPIACRPAWPNSTPVK